MPIAKQLATLVIILAACFLLGLVESRADRLSDCPDLMLWAWERPEDLRWIDPRRTGVAFLARTLLVYADTVSVVPRRQALEIPKGTYVMAVVRIESNPRHPATFDQSQIKTVVQDILRVGDNANIRSLQIDFDARASERAAYQSILEQVRRALPDRVGLSMTALASWCAGDRWLEALPVDEAVPMFFRMGVLNEQRSQYLEYLSRFDNDKGYRRCKCGTSIGLATDELLSQSLSHRRIYLFSPHSWSIKQALSISRLTRYQ